MDMQAWQKAVLEGGMHRPMPVLSFPATQLLGITVRDFVFDGEAQAQGMAAIARRCRAAAAVSAMDLSVEAECFGAQVHVTDDEVPTVVSPVVAEPEDAERLAVPAVGAGRTGVYLDAVSRALELIQDRPVFAGMIGPLSLAGRLMDMTEIMVHCYESPEMVHLVLEKATDFLIAYARAYRDRGAHGIVMAEPASGLLSPDLCAEFSSPYVRRIVDAVQDDTFLVIYHNCGPAVARMVPEILETGAAAYHFGNAVPIKQMLALMPEDKLVMGNVDPVGAFRNGTPESMRQTVTAVLTENAGHKNFLLSSGCDIPPATPWENIDAFFASAEAFYDGDTKQA